MNTYDIDELTTCDLSQPLDTIEGTLTQINQTETETTTEEYKDPQSIAHKQGIEEKKQPAYNNYPANYELEKARIEKEKEDDWQRVKDFLAKSQVETPRETETPQDSGGTSTNPNDIEQQVKEISKEINNDILNRVSQQRSQVEISQPKSQALKPHENQEEEKKSTQDAQWDQFKFGDTGYNFQQKNLQPVGQKSSQVSHLSNPNNPKKNAQNPQPNNFQQNSQKQLDKNKNIFDQQSSKHLQQQVAYNQTRPQERQVKLSEYEQKHQQPQPKQEETIKMTFMLFHERLNEFKDVKFRFTSWNYNEQIKIDERPMIKVTDNIYYLNRNLKKKDFEQAHQFSYEYTMAAPSHWFYKNQNYKCDKIYRDQPLLQSYFDTPNELYHQKNQGQRVKNESASSSLSQILKFLISQFNTNSEFGQHQRINEFIQFYKRCYFDLTSDVISALSNQLTKVEDGNIEFFKYCLVILHYLKDDIKKNLNDNNKQKSESVRRELEKLIDMLTLKNVGVARQCMIELNNSQDNLWDIYSTVFKDIIFKQKLIVALQFLGLDYSFIPTIFDINSNLKLQTEAEFLVFKDSLQFILIQDSVKENSKKMLIDKYLKQSTSMKMLLDSYLQFKGFIKIDEFMKSFNTLFDKAYNYEKNEFFNQNLDLILENEQLSSKFENQIQTLMIEFCQQADNHRNQNLFSNNTALSIRFIKKLSMQENTNIQTKLCSQILFNSIDRNQSQYKTSDITEIMTNIFRINLNSFKNLKDLYKGIPSLIQFTHNQRLKQVKGYDDNFIKDLRAKIFMSVVKRISDFQYGELIQDIKQIFKEKQDEKQDLQMQIVDGLVEALSTKYFKNPDLEDLDRLFNAICHNEQLINMKLRPVVGFILAKIEQRENIKEFSEIVENPLLMKILKLRLKFLDDESGKIMDKITQVCQHFIRDIDDLTISMEQFNLSVKDNKATIKEIADILNIKLDPSTFEKIEMISNQFSIKLAKCDKFKDFIEKRVKIYVNVASLTEEINKKNYQKQNAPIRQLINPGIWQYFEQFQTFEYFEALGDSKVFGNIFNECKMDLNHLVQQRENNEEVKGYEVNLNLGANIQKLSPIEFDQFCFNRIFKQKFIEVFQQLLNYPDQTILNGKFLKAYFRNVKKDNVTSELSHLLATYKISNNPGQNFSPQLINDLKSFRELDELNIKSQIILSLLNKLPSKQIEKVNDDKNYELIKNYLQFYKDFNDETLLTEIRQYVLDVDQFMFQIEKKLVDFQLLESIINQQEIFDFAIGTQEMNFNDLLDEQEDDSYLNMRALEDMNSIQKVFKQINSYCKQPTIYDTLIEAILGISIVIQGSVKSEPHFSYKLVNCSKNLASFKALTQNKLNKAENTCKIISDILQNGNLSFIMNDSGKCSFTISIGGKILDQQKIDEHRSRGLILAPAKKLDEEKERINKFNTLKFNNVFLLSESIQEPYQELCILGYFEMNGQQQMLDMNFTEDILLRLESKREEYKKNLLEWKNLLSQLKQKYYIFTFVPNNKLHAVLQFFQTHNQEYFNECFSIFQLINPDIKSEELYNYKLGNLQDCSVEVQLEELGKLMTKVFTKVDQEGNNWGHSQDHKLPASYNIGDQSKRLLKGEVQYTQVKNDIELCLAILALYSYTNYFPEASEVLFCNNENTQLELENFIMRAMLAPKYYKRPKLYVIANFQDLEFKVQLNVHAFLKEQSKEHKGFYLNVIVQCKDIKKIQLVEAIKSCQPFTGIPQKTAVQELLKPFNERIQCVFSEVCGYGKSTYIKDKITSDHEVTYVRIPLQGQMDRLKLSKVHNAQLDNVKNYSIHYDMRPFTGQSINILMFELLILNCINNEAQGIFHFKKNVKFIIEIDQCLNKNFLDNLMLISFFQRTKLEWRAENIKIKDDGKDKYQIVSKFINEVVNKPGDQPYNQAVLRDHLYKNNVRDCQRIINNYFQEEQQRGTLNFYVLNSFVNFVSQQIDKILQSSFLEIGVQFEDIQESEQIFKTIVYSLITFAKQLLKNQAAIEQQKHSLENKSEEEQLAKRFEEMRWDRNSSLLIIISDSHTLCPIYKNVEDLPIMLRELHTRAPKVFREFKDLSSIDQIEFYQQIYEQITPMNNQKLNVLINTQSEPEQEFFKKQIAQYNLDKIVFTRDNFLKLILIFIRLKADIPVILMGETGVGKTAIINYLAERLNANFFNFNIHAGITEEQIIEYVNKAKEQANRDIEEYINKNYEGLDRSVFTEDGLADLIADEKDKIKQTIIFLDEINTNDNINGILKEIIIDKCMNGVPLLFNIRIIAACNPYKLKTEKQQQLSSGIRKANQDNIKANKLVYQVHRLLESMTSFTWDFGSLPKEEEETYVRKLIEKSNKESKSQVYTDREIQYISHCVCASQEFIRNYELSSWSVSLRDAARFAKLIQFFSKNNSANDNNNRFNDYSSKKRALVLTLAFCYMYRINSIEGRRLYQATLSKIRYKHNCPMIEFNEEQFERIMQEEQSRYLENMEIPPGIGKNTPLKENVFSIITCILNNIPLIITGKPGSSKTLAMNFVTKSMRGKGSQNDFFKNLPAVIQSSYQGSVQSTSNGIVKAFDKGIKTKNDNEGEIIISLVFIDEIGLAEMPPYNPLKVLHSLLEPPQVAFVGISNWSLDASKMNRAITLCRPDPSDRDLKESIDSINNETNQHRFEHRLYFKEQLSKSLVTIYLKYLNYQEEQAHVSKEGSHFHGLRDFYALIQYICLNLNPKDLKYNQEVIAQGLIRNFGGRSFEKILRLAENQGLISSKVRKNYANYPTVDLIKSSIQARNVRHLMISTDNLQTAIQYVEEKCKETQTEYRIFSGSDFPQDLTDQATYKLIHDIILLMEKGILVILLNLESIYQSFYDMLNQNYQIIGSQRFCKVAIGADSSRCTVHENFKCILVCHESGLRSMAAPLLNRFEKQRLLESQTVTNEDQERVSFLRNWLTKISQPPNTDFNQQFMFPTLDNQDLTYLVLQTKEIYEQQRNDEYCQRIILQLANMPGIIRSSLIPNVNLSHIYHQNGIHYNIENLFNLIQEKSKAYNLIFEDHFKRFQNEANADRVQEAQPIIENDLPQMQMYEEVKQDDSKRIIQLALEEFNSEIKGQEQENTFLDVRGKGLFTGYNIIVHTYYLYLENLKQKDLYQQITLSNIVSKTRLEEQVNDFFFKDPQPFLIIIAHSLTDSQQRISLCRSVINEQRVEYCNQFRGMKNVCIIIRQSESSQLKFSFAQGWIQIFIDTLNGVGDTKYLSCEKLNNMSIQDILKDDDMVRELILSTYIDATSILDYHQKESLQQKQVDKISTLLHEDQDALDLIKDLILLNIKLKPELRLNPDFKWQEDVCFNEVLMQVNNSFHSAAVRYLQSIMKIHLAFIFYHMQNSGLLNHLSKQVKQFAYSYFKKQYIETLINEELREKYDIIEQSKSITYPYCREIHELLISQAPNIDNNLIDKKKKLDDQCYPSEEEFEKLGEIAAEDRALVDSVKELTQQCQAVFDQTFIVDDQIIQIDIESYFDNLSLLMKPNINNPLFHQLMPAILKIIQPNFESLIELYVVQSKHELFIDRIFDLFMKIRFDFDKMMHQLQIYIAEERKQNDHLKYLPRAIIIKCLGQVLFDFYYPSGINIKDFDNWADNTKQIFEIFDSLAQTYLTEDPDYQIKINFLINFCHKVLTPLELNQSENHLIEIAEIIKDEYSITRAIEGLQSQSQKLIQSSNLIEVKKKYQQYYSKFIFDSLFQELKTQTDLNTIADVVETALEMLNQYFTKYLEDQDNYLIPNMINLTSKLIEVLNNEDAIRNALYAFEEVLIPLDQEEDEEEKNQNDDLELLRILSDAVNSDNLDFDHPLILAISDALQTQIYFDVDYCSDNYNFDNEIQNLQRAMAKIAKTDCDKLDRLRSVAYFRAHVTGMTEQIIKNIIQGKERTCDSIIDCINTEIYEKQETYMPMLTYIVKQLLNYLNLDEIVTNCQTLLPAISLLRIPNINYKKYPISLDPQLRDEVIEAFKQNQRDKLASFLNLGQTQVLITFSEYLYANDKEKDMECKDMIRQSSLDQDYKEFFSKILNNKNGVQLQGYLDLSQEDPLLRRLQMLWNYAYIVARSMPVTSFLGGLLYNPKVLDDKFVPFQVNVKEDPIYYYTLYINDQEWVNDGFTRWQCRHCSAIFLVMNCGQFKSYPVVLYDEETKKYYVARNQGTMICLGCKRDVGFGAEDNSIPLDTEKIMKENFDSEPWSKPGYIFVGVNESNGIPIRGLDEIQARFGSLVLNTIIFCSLLYGNPQNLDNSIGFIKEIFETYNIVRDVEELTLEQIIDIFYREILLATSERIIEAEGISEDKLIAILMHIIKQMSLSNSFTLQNLQTLEKRRQFEDNFKTLCIPDSKALYQDFFSQIKEDDEIENSTVMRNLKETIVIEQESEEARNSNLYSLFRTTIIMKEQQVGRYVQNQKESPFLSLTLQYIKTLSKIQNLLPLINWVNYSFIRWNNQLFEENLSELTIIEFLLKGKDEKKYFRDKEMYKALSKATKQIQQLSIDEGCQRIAFQPITKKSMMTRALISQDMEHADGYTLYSMIKYLCMQQNNYLEAVSNLQGYEWLKQKQRNKINFLELTKDQIITTNELTYQKILDIIRSKSYQNLKYGMGKENHYSVDQIESELFVQLVQKKVFINYEGGAEFKYANSSSINNQYAVIMAKIPQEKWNESQKILSQLDDDEKRTSFKRDISTAMNYLAQTGGQPNSSLYNYLKAFQITQFVEVISHGPGLKHILHIFEEIEKELLPVYVRRTNQKYKKDITGIHKDQLNELLKNISDEDLLSNLQTLIGRLCVRRLCLSQESLSETLPLIEFLLIEDNVFLYGVQENNTQLKQLLQTLLKSNLVLGNSHNFYHIVEEKILKIIQDRQKLLDQDLKMNQMNQQQLQQAQKVVDDKVGRVNIQNMVVEQPSAINKNARQRRQFGQVEQSEAKASNQSKQAAKGRKRGDDNK